SRDHSEALPLGEAAALLHGYRRLPRAGRDRSRDPDFHHLSRTGYRAAAADSGAVDRADDRGDAVDLVGSGPRHRDPRPPRDQAVGLSVAAAAQIGLTQFRRAVAWTSGLLGATRSRP